MNIIFSRKGYDTSYGKGFSPILPDGSMLSMPIPASENRPSPKKLKEHKSVKYQPEKGLKLTQVYHGNTSYADLSRGLYQGADDDALHHYDPDLNHASIPNRPAGWRGAFGQAYAAQSHLASEGVKPGDLFLFFGSFKATYHNEVGQTVWERQHPFHAIFGYLEVGEILTADEIEKGKKKDLYGRHPHFLNKDIYGDLNALYLASHVLKDTKIPGSGTFLYNDNLRLTKAGYNKSVWDLPAFFHPDKGTKISRHGNKARFRTIGNLLLLETVAIGQDFVVKDASKNVQDWALELIKESALVHQ